MQNNDTKFDNIVLATVALIGVVLIGVSAKAVVKNNVQNQAAAVSVSRPLVNPAKPVKVNGVCGSANLKKWSIEPIEGFCTSGTLVNKRRTGYRIVWNCNGTGGGAQVNCYADQDFTPVANPCGAAAGKSFKTEAEVSKAGLCNGRILNTPSVVKKSTTKIVGKAVVYDKWQWDCQIAAKSNNYCSANRVADGVCGKYNIDASIAVDSCGINSSAVPWESLCSEGVPGQLTSACNGNPTWICGGVNGGKSASCSEKVRLNGVCGSANGKTYKAVPSNSAEFCARGAYVKGSCTGFVKNKSTCSWSCAGINNGAVKSCSLIVGK